MRRPDHHHVVELAHDLVALRSPRHATESPPSHEVSAPIAARLAVIWAAMAEPVLMCGSIASKSAEKVAHASELLDVGVRAWEDLDLTDDVSLPVRCGRVTHSVRLGAEDSLHAVSHRTLDVESERVAASFGADLLPCIAEMDQAELLHPPPTAASTGQRPSGVRAGELLAFVRLCREWLAAGFDLVEASPALMDSWRPDDLGVYLAAGLSVADAIAWRPVAADEASRWARVGFSAGDRTLWCGQGRSLADARAGVELSGDVRSLLRWARVTGDRLSAEAMGEWARAQPPTGVWSGVAVAGLSFADVQRWKQHGFQPVDILTYAQRDVSLDVALPWHEAGYSAYVATGFMCLGITVEQAYAMRSQPARQVQALWPRLQSVADVLAELERT